MQGMCLACRQKMSFKVYTFGVSKNGKETCIGVCEHGHKMRTFIGTIKKGPCPKTGHPHCNCKV